MRRPRAVRRAPDVAYADTNLFVALLAGPEHPTHEKVLGVFRRVADGELVLVVTPVVVAEVMYVLGPLLPWSRSTMAGRVGAMLEADGLMLVEGSTLLRALHLFGDHSKLDFADAYLAAAAIEVGPPVVASFDRDLDSIEGVRRLAG